MSSYNDNIKNAFSVVYKTLENTKKLMEYCDIVAAENGYVSCTSKFLRNNTDVSVDGWVYNKFIKIYQSSDDKEINTEKEEQYKWRNGPIYVLEINFEEDPVYYVSKFEYEKINRWKSGISPSDWWAFYFPTDISDDRIKFNKLDDIYTEGKPKYLYKDKYWGLNRTIFRHMDLIDVNSDNVSTKIFGEFNKLKEK